MSVFEHLWEKQFVAKHKKCEFAPHKIHYLGYVIHDGLVAEDPSKTEAVSTWPMPMCTKDPQQFLGLANY